MKENTKPQISNSLSATQASKVNTNLNQTLFKRPKTGKFDIREIKIVILTKTMHSIPNILKVRDTHILEISIPLSRI